eukprot:7285155-Pyramimonas_sp.AAC.1
MDAAQTAGAKRSRSVREDALVAFESERNYVGQHTVSQQLAGAIGAIQFHLSVVVLIPLQPWMSADVSTTI